MKEENNQEIEEEQFAITTDFDQWYVNVYEKIYNFQISEEGFLGGLLVKKIDKHVLLEQIQKNNITFFMTHPVAVNDHKAITAESKRVSVLDLSNVEILYGVKHTISEHNGEYYTIRGIFKK